MRILKNISLKNYNTFKIDVKASHFAEAKTIEEIQAIFSLKEFKTLKKFILGGGSNVLFVSDFDGVIIKNSIKGINILKEDDHWIMIEVGAGEKWHDLVEYCIDRNYGGIENLSLIPGTVGAAPIQNIGAYGAEIKDVLVSVKGIHLDNFDTAVFNNKDCKFGYRDSIFKTELKGKFIVSNVIFKLSKNPVLNLTYGAIKNELENTNKTEFSIKDLSEAVIRIRLSKLPDPEALGNAGSFFKNPVIDLEMFNDLKDRFPTIISYPAAGSKIKISAGWLIESCGWKGKRFGDAGVHINQALVIVNYGSASGKDILNLANQVKQSVQSKFDIYLEEEVNII